jgi:hypothetical protein
MISRTLQAILAKARQKRAEEELKRAQEGKFIFDYLILLLMCIYTAYLYCFVVQP